MKDPAWLVEARRHLGTREIQGARHEPHILQWWRTIRRGGIADDETPWCAAFVGACLENVGLVSSRFESARSYLDWGVHLRSPAVGCIVVFARDRGGHVGFVVGQEAGWSTSWSSEGPGLLVLGGNQGDAVSIAAFPRRRVLPAGYRWPLAVPLPEGPLPVASGAASPSEA